MRIVKEKFKTDQNNKLYWGRVYFISDDRQYKTKLIWAMSFEWVRRQLLAEIRLLGRRRRRKRILATIHQSKV